MFFSGRLSAVYCAPMLSWRMCGEHLSVSIADFQSHQFFMVDFCRALQQLDVRVFSF